MIFEDTYVCQFLASDNELADPNSYLTLVIKHPQIPGVDYLAGLKVPRKKHVSTNKQLVSLKNVKKVLYARLFEKENSLFASFPPDTDKVFQRCLYNDYHLTKINRLIKVQEDLDDTYMVLQKYYPLLRDQFNT